MAGSSLGSDPAFRTKASTPFGRMRGSMSVPACERVKAVKVKKALATKTAMITPAIAPNEPRGSSDSRRAASSVDPPAASRWRTAPTAAVSHGPT